MQKFTADTFPAAQTNGTHADHPVHLLTQSESLSVWGSIHKLLDINETLLGCLLLLLSGIWPLLKQGLILLLWFLPYCKGVTHRMLFVIDLIGKWSMVDILFVGLLMTVLKVDIRCAPVCHRLGFSALNRQQ